MKQLLLCSTLLITGATNMNAQSKSRMVGYKVLVDNPDKLRPGFVCLDILTADTWNTSSFMGYGLRSGFNASKFGSVSFDYRKGYLGAKQKAIELGGALNLISSRKKKPTFVVMSSSTFSLGNKMFMKNSGIEVSATRKTVLQARGGIVSFKTPIEIPTGNVSKAERSVFYMNKDTSTIKIGTGKGYRGVNGFDGIMRMQTYYVGMSVTTMRNVVLSYDEGVASNTNSFTFFFDILTGGDPRFTDLTYKYTASSLSLNDFPVGATPEDYAVSVTNVKNVGWRTGWEAKSYSGLAMSYKVEFGSRPGFKERSGILSANSYLLLTAGFGIGVGKPLKKLINEKGDQ